MSEMTPETLFHDLKPNRFPFTIEMYDDDTGNLLRTIVVKGPGSVQVPGKSDLGVDHVNVRLAFADGYWCWNTWDGEQRDGHS